ncbi:MAG TPA: hypothetical protein VM938_13580 [Acidimicrobiales bacterium]|nr:hypothetical protein [Acidimicrobiales bacterium]
MDRREAEGADQGADGHNEDATSSHDRSSRHITGPSGVVLPVYRDPEALASFFHKVDGEVRATLRRQGLAPESVNDIAQEAWLRLFKRGPALGTAAETAKWLSLVSYRLAVQTTRKERRRVRRLREVFAEGQEVLPDVAERVELRSQLPALLDAFRSLSDSDRTALVTAANATPRGSTRRERDAVSLRVLRARRRLLRRLRGWLAGLPISWLPSRQSQEVIQGTTRWVGACAVVAVTVAVGGAVVSSQPANELAATNAFVEREGLPSDPGVGAPHVRRVQLGPVPQARRSAEPAASRAGADTGGTRTLVVLAADGQPRAVVGEPPRRGGELMCHGNLPLIEPQCIEHPLRRLPPATLPTRD